jgi:hypothetical protein
VPARVFIDGVLQRKRAPLTNYPVKPGNRNFTLESVATKQHFDFSVRFGRGEHRVVEQKFESTPRR